MPGWARDRGEPKGTRIRRNVYTISVSPSGCPNLPVNFEVRIFFPYPYNEIVQPRMIVPHVSGTRYSIFHFKCGYESPGTRKERRRVSSRSIEFGLTQRPFQRLDGGQEPIPGRHGVGEGGHSALDSIITPPGPEINPKIPVSPFPRFSCGGGARDGTSTISGCTPYRPDRTSSLSHAPPGRPDGSSS